MRSYWAWFGWLAAVWTAALAQAGPEAAPWGIAGCAFFLAFYFLVPLVRSRPALLFAMLAAGLPAAAAALYGSFRQPEGIIAGSLYMLLFTSFLTGEAAYRLPYRWSAAYAVLSALFLTGVFYAARILDGSVMNLLPAVVLYAAALAASLAAYSRGRQELVETGALYEALLGEYRKLKRMARSAEEAARLEERTNIARQIHDSVGHKLTALLMQLEVFRMNAGGESRVHAEQMKRLAKEGLDETRRAVRALNEQEQGGIPAILRLIRNLEAESFLQVEFTLGHGVLLAELGNEQSIAVYRAVQEALTNAMRHGSSRRIEVRLEAPGGRIFRYEISNESAAGADGQIHEGFGLRTMRERIERLGGRLELFNGNGTFVLRGVLPLEQAKESRA